MLLADLPAGLDLCRAAAWNQLEADWRCFLEWNPAGCVVAEEQGCVVGTVATLRFEARFAWISMLLVDPAWRHRGIGSMLLEEALRLLSDIETIRLDATPAGRLVYDKFGFMSEYPLLRCQCHPVEHALVRATPALLPALGVRPITPQEFPAILALDREIFGADRSPLLRNLYQRAPQYAFASGESYCLGRPGFESEHIGPVVATDPQTAQALVTACLSQTTRPCTIDSKPVAPDWLRSVNLTPERPFVRMYRGPHRHPGIPGRQFAIAGPEFG